MVIPHSADFTSKSQLLDTQRFLGASCLLANLVKLFSVCDHQLALDYSVLIRVDSFSWNMHSANQVCYIILLMDDAGKEWVGGSGGALPAMDFEI